MPRTRSRPLFLLLLPPPRHSRQPPPRLPQGTASPFSSPSRRAPPAAQPLVAIRTSSTSTSSRTGSRPLIRSWGCRYGHGARLTLRRGPARGRVLPLCVLVLLSSSSSQPTADPRFVQLAVAPPSPPSSSAATRTCSAQAASAPGATRGHCTGTTSSARPASRRCSSRRSLRGLLPSSSTSTRASTFLLVARRCRQRRRAD